MRPSKFIVFTFILISQAWAQTSGSCIVISGNKRDHNGVLDKPLFKQQQVQVGGRNCQIVDGWNEALALAETLPKDSDLLLVQGAHGYKDATFACNSGDVSADEVLSHLEALSKKHKLGAVIHSCFSGEVMRKKLMKDQFAPEGLEKMCLVTSSQFGRLTYAHSKDMASQLEEAKPGQTLEDLFLASSSGLISSAAWTEAGVPLYLTTKDVSSGMKVLQNVDSITRFDGVCDTPAEASAALCASPSVNREVFDLLSTFKEPIIRDDLKYFTISNLENRIKTLTKEKKEGDPKSTRVAQGLECFEGVMGFYQKKFGENLENLERLTELRPALKEFSQLPAHKACELYKQDLDEWSQRSIFFQSFTMALEDYENAQEELSQIFKSHRFDENFDLISFAKAAIGDKRICRPEDKMDILQSLLGESFFMDEFAGFWDPNVEDMDVPDENILGREFSTQIALKGFQNSSILRNSPQNSADKARSQACKDFKL